MLQEQVSVLELKQLETMSKIDDIETELKKAKAELVLIKRAKQSLTKLEEQLNGQADISE